MMTQLDLLVLFHLIHRNIDYQTRPLSSIFFSAEIKAVDLPLDQIQRSKNINIIICSDSFSVLLL